jgi:CHAD domain-containing protein
VALALLDVVVAARKRLPDGSDALHDFRVALRRLRSWLRAFRPWLPDTGRRHTRRALAALADASNHARDAEVGLAWLQAQRDLPPPSGRELSRLVHRLRHELRSATRRFNEQLSLEFNPVVNDLERKLVARTGDSLHPGPGNPPTRSVHAALIRAHAADLAAALHRVRTVDDEAFAHRARIAGKRLRYLLQPLTGNPKARQAVRRLIRLQDALGELHDSCVLIERLHLVHPALAQRMSARTARAFARVERGWLGARTKDLHAAFLWVSSSASPPAA